MRSQWMHTNQIQISTIIWSTAETKIGERLFDRARDAGWGASDLAGRRPSSGLDETRVGLIESNLRFDLVRWRWPTSGWFGNSLLFFCHFRRAINSVTIWPVCNLTLILLSLCMHRTQLVAVSFLLPSQVLLSCIQPWRQYFMIHKTHLLFGGFRRWLCALGRFFRLSAINQIDINTV